MINQGHVISKMSTTFTFLCSQFTIVHFNEQKLHFMVIKLPFTFLYTGGLYDEAVSGLSG